MTFNSRELKKYFSLAQSITRLLYPYAEVVIHDLKKNKIVGIYNSFSKRKAGDLSLIDVPELNNALENMGDTYEKINWDGRRLKSISIAIGDDEKKPAGLLCINLDISVLEKLELFIQNFISADALISQPKKNKQPQALFKNDWRERINQFVQQYLQQKKLALKNLSIAQKKKLVLHLYAKGAFEGKNAANYIAQILDISRATVYNYLK